MVAFGKSKLRAALVAVWAIQGCSPAPLAGPVSASFQAEMTPRSACIGQNVTMTGTGAWKGHVAIWFAPERDYKESPSYNPLAVKVGEVAADAQGKWTYTFEMKANMGQTASGSDLILQPDQTYAVQTMSDNDQLQGTTFTTCAP